MLLLLSYTIKTNLRYSNQKNHRKKTIKRKSNCEESVECNLRNCREREREKRGWKIDYFPVPQPSLLPRTFPWKHIVNICRPTYKWFRVRCRLKDCRMSLHNTTNFGWSFWRRQCHCSQSFSFPNRRTQAKTSPTSKPPLWRTLHIQSSSRSESSTSYNSMAEFHPFCQPRNFGADREKLLHDLHARHD